jgi:hypothetical protein
MSVGLKTYAVIATRSRNLSWHNCPVSDLFSMLGYCSFQL